MIDGLTIYMGGDTGRAWKSAVLDDIKSIDTHTYKGRYKNFMIRENVFGVSISGSVAKYELGNNIDCSTGPIYDGLDKLGEALHIDLHKGIVRAAEFAETVIVRQPIHEYLALLGNIKGGRLKRHTDALPYETVRYSTRKGGEAFKAYDKKAEILSHGEQLLNWLPPNWYKYHHLLRLELRIDNQTSIRKWLGGGYDLTPYDLTREDVYNRFKERFLSRYESIEKTGRQVYMTNKVHTAKSFLDCLAVYTAQHNTDFYNGLMASALAAGMTRDNKSRIKSALRKAAADIQQVGSNELIDEVDGYLNGNVE